MSYDLNIAPKTPTEDWSEVLTRLESHAENLTCSAKPCAHGGGLWRTG